MEDDYDLGTGMVVISIVLEAGAPPQIELDGCNPCVAAQIFRDAAELLGEVIMRPTIRTQGELIATDDTSLFFDFNDDEEL